MTVKTLENDMILNINNIKFVFKAGTDVSFYDNGVLKDGILASDILSSRNTVKFKAGTKIGFDETGELKEQHFINIEQINGGVIMTPTGSLELNHSLKLEELIERQLTKGDKNFIIDLNNSDYISSCGIRVLMTSFRQIKSHEGKFILIGLNDSVIRILKTVDLSNHFDIKNNIDEALAAIK